MGLKLALCSSFQRIDGQKKRSATFIALPVLFFVEFLFFKQRFQNGFIRHDRIFIFLIIQPSFLQILLIV